MGLTNKGLGIDFQAFSRASYLSVKDCSLPSGNNLKAIMMAPLL